MRVEDDDGDFAVAQHAQLVGLLHQPKLALRERHLRQEVWLLQSGDAFYSASLTWRLRSSLMRVIWIFLRPMVMWTRNFRPSRADRSQVWVLLLLLLPPARKREVLEFRALQYDESRRDSDISESMRQLSRRM